MQGPRRGLGERLLALDAFRGLAIAAMILVNNPGTWRHTHPLLRHANWHWWTPADLIFPFFLFIVGVAITLSIDAALQHGTPRWRLAVKVARRTLIIFGLGIFLNGFPSYDWSEIRVLGVLQRIALCYFFASAAVLSVGARGQAAVAVTLLLGYWMLMKFVPVPGYGTGSLDPQGNLAAYIDDALLHGHLLREGWDPEGILSTLPAIGTTLAGVLTGHWLRSSRSPAERAAGLFVMGNAGLMIGLLMHLWFPINKSLWTSSFAVFSAGMALNVLGMCYWLIDLKGYQACAKPLVIYGVNPLLAYLLSSLMSKVTVLWFVTRPDGSRALLRTYIFETFFLPLASRPYASFLYAVAYVLLWLGVMAVLYRKRIFFKI
jgi:predicted acyltransferase